MARGHLSTYLNDHLAGSVTALELLTNIASSYAGTDVERLALEIHQEVAADREQLEALMAQLGIAESSPRKVSAWIAEKIAQLKLRISDPRTGAMRLLESTEAVAIGIQGKRLLWQSLSAAAEREPKLRGLDYQTLIQRAEDQFTRLSAARLEAARNALDVE